MKKLLLGLGSIASVVVPVVTVVSCSSSDTLEIKLDFSDVTSANDITNKLDALKPKFNSLSGGATKNIHIHLVDDDAVFDATINENSQKDGMHGFTQKYLEFAEKVFQNHGFSAPTDYSTN